MRVLVTGAAGMLGTDLCEALITAGHEVIATDVSRAPISMDITDASNVRDPLEAHAPDAVIHCAAYTNVDQAEREPDVAHRLNAHGSTIMAQACAERDIPICAISTDFVFDGTKEGYYVETDTPNPLNVYGASKLAGENAVRELCRKHWIVRTAWLFGVHGKSFPNSIITAAQTRPELKVVADQHGTPTFTRDLADMLIRVVTTPLEYGTYHVSNTGVTTWYDFARKAVELAGMDASIVKPIPAADWPTPTRRPANSAMRSLALEAQGVDPLRPWEEALAEFMRLRVNTTETP